jgi:hypothetical protein
MCPNATRSRTKYRSNLDVFGALILHGVCGHVDSTHIVTEDNGGAGKGSMKLLWQLTEPTSLSDSIGNGSILGLGAGAGDSMLPLGGPRYQIVAKENTVAGGRATSVRTTSPIRVRVSNQAISS